MGIPANPHRGQPALCQAGCLRPALHPYTSMWAGGKVDPPMPEVQPLQEMVWRVCCWGGPLAEEPSLREAGGTRGAPGAAGIF